MSNTTNLVLPCLAVAQAQKHVTVNETLRRHDAVVQLSVVSASTTAQPGSPADDAVYIVPAGKSGADWNAYANGSLGYYRDGAWEQVSPREGWLAYVKDTDQLLAYTGSAWEPFALGKLLTLSATDTLIGRSTAGAGAAEEITCTAAGRAARRRGRGGATDDSRRVARAGGERAGGLAHGRHGRDGAGDDHPAGRRDGGEQHTAHHLDLELHKQSEHQEFALPSGGQRRHGHAADERQRDHVGWQHGPAPDPEPQRASSQFANALTAGASFGINGSAGATTAVDTSTDQPIVLSGLLADADEAVTLESYLVEVAYRA